MTNPNRKLKMAIFDLTDCEGCELQFLALREKLAELGHNFELTNWRLGSSDRTAGPFDVTFIEGSPMTEADIETVKQARRLSRTIVTLGTCAVLGGVQAMLPEVGRKKALADIYGQKYQTKNKLPKPVSYYVNVDIHLPGCPVNPKELERLLSTLALGKKFRPITTSVCLDCKKKQNACLFLDEGFCLGPVTRGGCGAPCPSAGLRCYGCFGPMPDANLEALEAAAPHQTFAERERALRLFFKNAPEYKDYQTKPKKDK
jgi:sulfhydrogenase subunit delta